MRYGLNMFLNALTRDAEECGLHRLHCALFYEKWLSYIRINQLKYPDHNIRGSHFYEMMLEFFGFFEKNKEIFDSEGAIDLPRYADLFEKYGEEDLFEGVVTDKYTIGSFIKFTECLIQSFRMAIMGDFYPVLLVKFKERAIRENLFNPNILVNVKYWMGCVTWRQGLDGHEFTNEMCRFIKDISYGLPGRGHMISLTTLYKFLENSNGEMFTVWSPSTLNSGIDLLMETFTEAEKEVEWPDIVFEKLNNPEIHALTLNAWLTTHMEISQSFTPGELLRSRIETIPCLPYETLQKRIAVIKKYYHNNFVYITGHGFELPIRKE